MKETDIKKRIPTILPNDLTNQLSYLQEKIQYGFDKIIKYQLSDQPEEVIEEIYKSLSEIETFRFNQ
jgi:translation elongation factor EF-1beta